MLPTFSWLPLLTMLLLFGVSLAMFLILERRWTTQRKWVAMRDWARQRGMRVSREGELPQGLDMLKASVPRVKLGIGQSNISLLQVETLKPQMRGWNVLAWRCGPWQGQTAALRPVNLPVSVLDQLNLPSIPTLVGTDRFICMATDTRSGRALVNSKARALLPRDIGLLRSGEWLVLDFSSRPFDPMELDRMLALAKQLIQLV